MALEFDVVIESLKAPRTKSEYKFHLKRYYNWLSLHQSGDKTMDIMAYLLSMKKEGLSYAYRNVAFSAIKHYHVMHDIILNWEKIFKYLGDNVKKNSLRGYTRDEIRRMLEVASPTYRMVILIFCSTGMRREALTQIKIPHMEYLSDYHLYKIKVYPGTREEYVCFTTPEAADAIKLYLSTNNIGKEEYLHNTIPTSVTQKLREIAIKAGVSKEQVTEEGKGKPIKHQYRNEIPAVHGTRKFCITQMAKADKDENGKPIKETRVNTEIAKLLTGHSIGVRGDYVEYDDDNLLQEYLKAIDRLTIQNENRLAKELDYLKGQKDKRIKTLEAQVKGLEEGQKGLHQMYRERLAAWEEDARKTPEEKKQEHEMELRKAFAPGKYKYVKLMEERDGKWQEILPLKE